MSTNLRIDGERLVSRLAELSRIGATPEGGCRRLALSDEDKQGRDWLVGQLQALRLDVKVDAIGNIVGILKGQEDGAGVSTARSASSPASRFSRPCATLAFSRNATWR